MPNSTYFLSGTQYTLNHIQSSYTMVAVYLVTWSSTSCKSSPRMETPFGCHGQSPPCFLVMLSNMRCSGSQGIVWQSWWSWNNLCDIILPNYIFNSPSTLGVILSFLNNFKFLLTEQPQPQIQRAFPSYLARPYPWGFRKKAMDLYFWNGKGFEERPRTDSLLSELPIHAVESGVLLVRFDAPWNIAQQLGQLSVPQIWNAIHSALVNLPRTFI